MSGTVCAARCGNFQIAPMGWCRCIDRFETRDGKCVFPRDWSWLENAGLCNFVGNYVSIRHETCVEMCESDEVVNGGYCNCKDGVLSLADGRCVPQEECTRLVYPDYDGAICSAANTCGERYHRLSDGNCTTGCSPWIRDPKTGERVCTTDCEAKGLVFSADECVSCYRASGQWLPLWNGSECISCPEDSPNWDPVAEKCIACPDDRPIWDGLECQACPVGAVSGRQLVWDPLVQSCLTACLGGRPASKGVCQSCEEAYASEGKTFWNTKTKECVKSCPELTHDRNCVLCSMTDEL